MPIEWPNDKWRSLDADTEDFRRARDEAVEKVFNLARVPIVAVSGA